MTNTNKPTVKWYRDPDAQGDRNGSWFFGPNITGDNQDAIACVTPIWGPTRGSGIGKPDYYVARVVGQAPKSGRFQSIRLATKACDEWMAGSEHQRGGVRRDPATGLLIMPSVEPTRGLAERPDRGRVMAGEQRRDQAGRYAHKTACDACGKVAGETYATDDEVCGATDGPGFFLCQRPACMAAVPEGLEERRTYYTAQRTKNDAAESKRRARWKAKHPDA